MNIIEEKLKEQMDWLLPFTTYEEKRELRRLLQITKLKDVEIVFNHLNKITDRLYEEEFCKYRKEK